MIREVEGDILLTKAQVVAHGVAPGDHFDSGLALALRERWPAMVTTDPSPTVPSERSPPPSSSSRPTPITACGPTPCAPTD